MTIGALLIAVAAAAAQQLRADRSTNITVRVVGTLTVQMPTVAAGCSTCAISVPVSSNWNLPPGAPMGVTFLTKLTDLKPKPGTAVIHRALAQGRGGSSLLVRLAPTRDAGPTIVTIEAQNY